MGFFARMRERIAAAKARTAATEALTQQLLAAGTDGRIDAAENALLSSGISAAGLQMSDLGGTRMTVYMRAFAQAKSDGAISDEEMEELRRLRQFLDLSDEDVHATDAELARLRLLTLIQAGELPVIDVPGLLLQRGEVAHWATDADLLEERVLRRSYQGGSRGTTIRVMKGVSFRVRATRGQMVSESGIVPVSTGRLVITSKRVLFLGNPKGFTVRLDKVLGVEMYADGLQIMDDKGNPRLLRLSPTHADFVGAVLSQAMNSYG